MAETPTPQPLDADDTKAQDSGSAESTGRRRSVSAFSPAVGSRPPPEGTMTDEQSEFVAALRQCDVGSELRGEELGRVAAAVRGETRAARCIDVLAAYYAADGRTLDAERRRATDRWFLFETEPSLHAAQVVTRLSHVAPELGDVQLVRVGGEHGALVLRSGDDVCALHDEPDSEGVPNVTVRDVVRGFNVLLDRKHVRVRLLGLAGDGSREAFVGQSSMSAALTLLAKGYLAADTPEELMELCAW